MAKGVGSAWGSAGVQCTGALLPEKRVFGESKGGAQGVWDSVRRPLGGVVCVPGFGALGECGDGVKE